LTKLKRGGSGAVKKEKGGGREDDDEEGKMKTKKKKKKKEKTPRESTHCSTRDPSIARVRCGPNAALAR
jgi:hypothetical protein